MTLRTGKVGRYRYYACSIKARRGETSCKGRSIPMEKLDGLVAEHIARIVCYSRIGSRKSWRPFSIAARNALCAAASTLRN